MSAHGPDPLFAAMQQDACNGRLSGLSADAAGTAEPDPERSLSGYLGRDPLRAQPRRNLLS
jgi:hypothetical protein